MAQSIFGYGGLLIASSTDQAYQVFFGFANTDITFKKVNTRKTAITGRIHQTSICFRPVINASIALCSYDDVSCFKTLNNLIENSIIDGIVVYPNYDANNNSTNIGYTCYLDSDVEYLQINDRVQIGQTIQLQFIGKEIITTLPDNVSNPFSRILIDGSGNTYIDGSGNTYITT